MPRKEHAFDPGWYRYHFSRDEVESLGGIHEFANHIRQEPEYIQIRQDGTGDVDMCGEGTERLETRLKAKGLIFSGLPLENAKT